MNADGSAAGLAVSVFCSLSTLWSVCFFFLSMISLSTGKLFGSKGGRLRYAIITQLNDPV